MTPDHPWSASETTAIVFLTGFAIQQLLQILDGPIEIFIAWHKARVVAEGASTALSDGDFKKNLMAVLSFALGVIVVWVTHIRLLSLLNSQLGGGGDFVVSALVVGSGTEATNTLLKFIGYVKDAQKPAATLSITPLTASVKVGMAFQFAAVLTNSDSDLAWDVVQAGGGTITGSGLYTAPSAAGTYQIKVTNKADTTKVALATVTVTT